MLATSGTALDRGCSDDVQDDAEWEVAEWGSRWKRRTPGARRRSLEFVERLFLASDQLTPAPQPCEHTNEHILRR